MRTIVYSLNIKGGKDLADLATLAKQMKTSFGESQSAIDGITVKLAALRKEGLAVSSSIRDIEKTFKALNAGGQAAQDATDALKAQGKTVDDLDKEYVQLIARQKELRDEASLLRKSQKDLQKEFTANGFPADSIIGLRLQYKKLKEEIDGLSSSDPAFKSKAAEAGALASRLNELNKEAGDFRNNIGRYEESVTAALDGTTALISGNITELVAALGVGGALGKGLDLIGDGVETLSNLSAEFIKLRGEASLLTGQTGAELDKFASGILAISKTFDQDYNEVLRTSNALSQQLGITSEESLKIIGDGFLTSANTSGNLLESLSEFAPFINEAKISTGEFLNILVESQNQSVIGTKGIDSIKEALISLREFPKATQEAIEGIGLSSEEIRKQIEEEGVGAAIKTVSAQLGTLRDDSPEVGTAIADIFKGAGEDAGLQFIRSLATIDSDISGLIDTTNDYTAAQIRTLTAQQRFADAQAELANSIGNVRKDFQVLGQEVLATVLTAIVKFINAIKSLPEFVRENKVELTSLGVALVSFNASLIASSTTALLAAARTKALTIATTAQATAQRVLNLAMRANPIGLVVSAVAILVGGLTALYNRSLEVRSVINGLGATANEFFEIIKDSFASFVEGFNKAKNLDFKGALASFGEALRTGNPTGEAEEEGSRLKRAYARGYSKTKIDAEVAESEKQIRDSLAKIGENERAAEVAGKKVGDGISEGIKSSTGRVKNAVDAIQTEIDKFSISALQGALTQLNKELTETSDENIIRDKLLEIANTQEKLNEVELATARIRAQIDRQNQPESTAPAQIETLSTPTSVSSLDPSNNIDEIVSDREAIAEVLKETNEQIFKDEQEQRQDQLEEIKKLEEQKQDILVDSTELIGGAVGELLSGEIDSFADFQKAILAIALDALEKVILLEIAAASARSIASADSVATFGATGVLKAALLTGLIKAAFAGVKSAIGLGEGGMIDASKGTMAQGERHNHRPNSGIRTFTKNGDTGIMVEGGEAVASRPASVGKSLDIISYLNQKKTGKKIGNAVDLPQTQKQIIDSILSNSFQQNIPNSFTSLGTPQLVKPIVITEGNNKLEKEIKDLKEEIVRIGRENLINRSSEMAALKRDNAKILKEQTLLRERLDRQTKRSTI